MSWTKTQQSFPWIAQWLQHLTSAGRSWVCFQERGRRLLKFSYMHHPPKKWRQIPSKLRFAVRFTKRENGASITLDFSLFVKQKPFSSESRCHQSFCCSWLTCIGRRDKLDRMHVEGQYPTFPQAYGHLRTREVGGPSCPKKLSKALMRECWNRDANALKLREKRKRSQRELYWKLAYSMTSTNSLNRVESKTY